MGDLASTNGEPWFHTPLHQACFHNRPIMVKALLELGAYELCAHLHSNPCGRGEKGTPLELARGGGHHDVVEILEEYSKKNEKKNEEEEENQEKKKKKKIKRGCC